MAKQPKPKAPTRSRFPRSRGLPPANGNAERERYGLALVNFIAASDWELGLLGEGGTLDEDAESPRSLQSLVGSLGIKPVIGGEDARLVRDVIRAALQTMAGGSPLEWARLRAAAKVLTQDDVVGPLRVQVADLVARLAERWRFRLLEKPEAPNEEVDIAIDLIGRLVQIDDHFGSLHTGDVVEMLRSSLTMATGLFDTPENGRPAGTMLLCAKLSCACRAFADVLGPYESKIASDKRYKLVIARFQRAVERAEEEVQPT